MQVRVRKFIGVSHRFNDNMVRLAQNSVSASGLFIAGIEIYGLVSEAGLDSSKE